MHWSANKKLIIKNINTPVQAIHHPLLGHKQNDLPFLPHAQAQNIY